uniref:Uncharacterized protein n=1 Tax=Anguilla anguilla TaxID=7936 RepID=A0A0E9VIL6_ANGAN
MRSIKSMRSLIVRAKENICCASDLRILLRFLLDH